MGARILVAVVFAALAVSFIASTALLVYEFRALDWATMLVAHGHLFFFFPTLGLLALCAFYFPAVVLTHLLWNYVYSGRNRLLLGLVAVTALSTAAANYLDRPPRAIWEVSPAALLADRGDPAHRRAPVLDTLSDTRQRSQGRLGLSSFARPCTIDPLLELPREMTRARYCFPAKDRLDARACCAVQAKFAETVAQLQGNPATRSVSAKLDAALFLPLKTFFLLIVVAIGVLLAISRESIDLHFRESVPRLERGVMIGALAMLLWPIMDYGYQQTSDALFGRVQSGPQMRLSLVIAPWALLLTFYFLRRLGKQAEIIGQLAGLIVTAIAVTRFDKVHDGAARLFGIGADPWMLILVAALSALGVVALLGQATRERRLPAAAGALGG